MIVQDAYHGANNRFSVLSVDTCTSDDNDDVPALSPEIASLPPTILIRTADTKLRRSTRLGVQLESPTTHATLDAQALLDSGATASFLDTAFVRLHRMPTRALDRAIPVYNIDGTLNESGAVREYVDTVMRIGDHSERMSFAVCALGSTNVIIGHPWL